MNNLQVDALLYLFNNLTYKLNQFFNSFVRSGVNCPSILPAFARNTFISFY